MNIKWKNIIKKVVIYSLCLASVVNVTLSGAPLVTYGSGSSDILGTNQALGSPILNEKATTDNWNKWEMVCWGVFLSNFCQPLIDSYESAFSTSSGEGSRGAGYQALCFGSGSDPENNDIIKNFTSYAIQTEKYRDGSRPGIVHIWIRLRNRPRQQQAQLPQRRSPQREFLRRELLHRRTRTHPRRCIRLRTRTHPRTWCRGTCQPAS